MMDLVRLIEHPELMDRESLYELRRITALYPYYQTARILMLKNLYLLHDSSFDEELRRSAIFLTDRRVIFNLVEAAHYKLEKENGASEGMPSAKSPGNRTISLIDTYLSSIPKEDEEPSAPKRKPTPADAAVDYVSYLLTMEGDTEKDDEANEPKLKGQDLIDSFLSKDGSKMQLKDEPEYTPQIESDDKSLPGEGDDGYFTETLANIYIKQGRYSKALEIIQRLNLNYPKKNAYFADQIRFLKKLIINENNKK